MQIKKKLSQRRLIHSDVISEIRVVDIDTIQPWKKNPRKNEQAIDRLALLIKTHGQRTPVVVWGDHNEIYKGNTTWFAMKKAGFEKIAVAFADFPSEKEAISYGISDNKSGEWADWDNITLAELLQGDDFSGMKSSDIGKITGFADKDLKGLLVSSTDLPDVLPDVDLSGTMPDKADFIVIQFLSKEEMHKFKDRLGFKTKHPRVVPYADLLTAMSWSSDSSESTTSLQLKKSIGKKSLKLKRK